MTKIKIEEKLDRLDGFTSLCIALVAIGVAGEFVTHHKEKQLTKQLTFLQDKELATLRDSTAKANEHVAYLERQRSIPEESRLELMKDIQKIPSEIRIRVIYPQDEAECHNFARRIYWLITGAALHQETSIDAKVFDERPDSVPVGVSVFAGTFRSPATQDAAELLRQALVRAKITKQDKLIRHDEYWMAFRTCTIVVGTKDPWQEETGISPTISPSPPAPQPQTPPSTRPSL